MTEENFTDFGKADGEAIREAVKGNADHPGLKDFADATVKKITE